MFIAAVLCMLAACSERIDVLASDSMSMPTNSSIPNPARPRRDGGLIPGPDDPRVATDAGVNASPCGACGPKRLCAVDTCVDALGVMSIDAWLAHTCEVNQGQLFCWGAGEQGQLGLGDRVSRNVRTRVGSYNDWLSVATGETSTCALRAPGNVYCFGDNSSGQLAQDGTQARLEPTRVETTNLIRSLSCGGKACCALDMNDALFCWGDNLEGMLGQDDPFGSPDSPIPLGVMPGTAWFAVDLGQGQVCAIRDDHALYCWGRNPEGEAGIGSEIGQARKPIRVGTQSDWVSVAGSQHHTCGVRSDGSLWCWGKNPFFEISAQDTSASFFSPTRVGTLSDWATVGTGWFHSCGHKRDGRLFCWGRAIEGQLAQGGGDPVREPTLVASPEPWQRYALGSFHTCGVNATGALYCWGQGTSGQLGLGDNQNRFAPELVP